MSDAPIGPGWRADVRDTIAKILDDRVPAVRGRVHRARVWPVTLKPALLVYGYAEQKKLVGQGGYQHQFQVTGSMVIIVKPEANTGKAAEIECEEIAGQVERAILCSPELFGTSGAILERCAAVGTQITAEQKDKAVEVEATIEFQLVWSEVFEVAEPDTSECAEVTFTPRATLIPSS
jgi:hypothetical protein